MNIPVRATITAFALAIVAGTANEVIGQPTQSSAQGDESAILALVANFERVFNEGDSAAVSRLYAIDGDRRDATGRNAKGREAVKQMYEDNFLKRTVRRNPPANETHFAGEVRLVSQDVALLDGFYAGPTGRGPFTLVLIKRATQWQIAAGRAGAIIP